MVAFSDRNQIKDSQNGEAPDSHAKQKLRWRPLIGTCWLLPIVGIIDVFGQNLKLSAQVFHQHLCSFYLAVSWAGCFAVRYNTDADSLRAAVPGSARYD